LLILNWGSPLRGPIFYFEEGGTKQKTKQNTKEDWRKSRQEQQNNQQQQQQKMDRTHVAFFGTNERKIFLWVAGPNGRNRYFSSYCLR